MSEQMNTYNRYIEQEDTIYKRLETLEQCQYAILHYIFRDGEQFNKLMVKEVLLGINQLEIDVRFELLHLRLEKAFLAYEMKHN
ncbi:hypothetical protein D3P07_04315 [Paenibacillus sp. 1011MAR3C5]|uniref:hypothetical protein n=1 Tax=Paenibacillus sp. 1011MAR3C5 TaxID=1675787 RepID=UPI000E6B733B|nr:hypothetical protein [Paenibacillus sp. 1011MAR3C5]RJE91284.1 hypothetical protein D3P07_04315 [Paenibacillus sp. 1011MAR3C5]